MGSMGEVILERMNLLRTKSPDSALSTPMIKMLVSICMMPLRAVKR